MRLAQPFFRLPVRFDVARLQEEVDALPRSAWAKHPNEIEGNSALRLISVDGGENDDVYGRMEATVSLRQCPYIMQVLSSFGVAWSRSRLMRLDAHSRVPEHADINYHWFYRVRMHIPITTLPSVRFHCDGQSVHMAPGEAWVFDNWRRHHVDNPTDASRIHLVADTSGTAAFWEFVARSATGQLSDGVLPYRPGNQTHILTERVVPRPVMPPAEVELLLADLRGELATPENTADARANLARYHALLQSFCFDWRQLYALHGESSIARSEYLRLLDRLRSESHALGGGIVMRTNGVAAHTVLEGRLLRHLLHDLSAASSGVAGVASRRSGGERRLQEPVFIVAAPRSGSTLLFETLRVTDQLWSLQDEAHWLVETIPELRPGTGGVDSNRLTAGHCTPAVAERITGELLDNLRAPDGRSLASSSEAVRFLEKTPKNSLRIPFFSQMFPDARFVLIWRDPRENLSSIMEAWRSGRWTTYRALEGWDGPWSLLLPPGWQALRGRPLEEVAAYQWDCANRVALEDLASLPRERWTSVCYADLVSDPGATVRRLCDSLGLDFDPALAARVNGPLPLSRYTQTAPDPEKWRRNEAEVLRVLPSVEPTWRWLQSLDTLTPRSDTRDGR